MCREFWPINLEASPLFQTVKAVIRSDSKEPTGELPAQILGVELKIDAQESFLNRIFGFGHIMEQSITALVDRSLVLLDDPAKGRVITQLGLFDPVQLIRQVRGDRLRLR
jgi:hypothetical protein